MQVRALPHNLDDKLFRKKGETFVPVSKRLVTLSKWMIESHGRP